VVTAVFISPVFGQDEPALLIEIYDSNWNESAGTPLFEGMSYNISISTENEPVVLGVNITFLGHTNTTSLDSLFVPFTAPRFDEHESFVITATKEGYLGAELEVTVIKGELSISADRGIVEEKKEFIVTVKDHNNNPIEGALVSVSPIASPVITDEHGVGYVDAPEVEQSTNLIIQVTKKGYVSGSMTIRVENAEGFGLDLSGPKFLQILPILIAVLVVIFAMVYVLWRQRRAPLAPQTEHRGKQTSGSQENLDEKQRQHFGKEQTLYSVKEKKDRSISNPQSRVEEIRIPVQEKKKETTILSNEKEIERTSVNKKNEPDEYFKGHDYMRYKIDEMTGKIDQNTDGKWFEGQRDSKYKVNETLKKSFKKKKDDEEDVK
jgi:hypothetical protein